MVQKIFIFISIVFSLTLFNLNANSNDINLKEKMDNRVKSTKLILMPPKTAKNKILDAIEEIDRSCCENEFSEKNKIIEIREILQNCIDKKCYSFLLPLYIEKKPPAKLVSLRQLDPLDDLLISHDKYKYDNLINKLNSKENEKIENEKNIDVVKDKLAALEKENANLKKTVDKMLLNYEKKILKLEEENKNISENFNIVFEAHSKNKQKKLEKELK